MLGSRNRLAAIGYAATKLVPSLLVGERTARDAYVFLTDLRDRCAPAGSRSLRTGTSPT